VNCPFCAKPAKKRKEKYWFSCGCDEDIRFAEPPTSVSQNGNQESIQNINSELIQSVGLETF
jgi:translation initiation factor 2 beta subunit (eIF-2beta)/eIF-5